MSKASNLVLFRQALLVSIRDSVHCNDVEVKTEALILTDVSETISL